MYEWHNKGAQKFTIIFNFLADVDISPNPNTFNFWTAESEYIKKKTGIRIHFFQSWRNLWIQLFGQNPYESIYGFESEYISFFAIQLPDERYGPQPKFYILLYFFLFTPNHPHIYTNLGRLISHQF